MRIPVEGLGFLRWRPFLGMVFKSLLTSSQISFNATQAWAQLVLKTPMSQKKENLKSRPSWRDAEISGFWNNGPIYLSSIIFYITKTRFFIAQVQARVEIGSKQLKWYHVIWYISFQRYSSKTEPNCWWFGRFYHPCWQPLMALTAEPQKLLASRTGKDKQLDIFWSPLYTLIWVLWLWLDRV